MNSSRKLQVFVSSTFKDLVKERQAAVEAILQAGHIPAGMELFTAGDESQWEAIKQWIEESDVLLLVFGQRYGSIEPKSRKSYTQLEYEYAIEKGKPVFSIILHQEWIDRKYAELKAEATDEFRTQHEAFRKLIMTRMIATVKDEKDIALEIGKSLNKFARDESLTGWVRANDLANSQALVLELRKTVEELRSRPQLGTPGVSEVEMELEGRIQELRRIRIHHESEYQYSNQPKRRYRVQGSALSLTWVYARNLEQGITGVMPGSGAPSMQAFIGQVEPWLKIWGFTESDTMNFYLTAKGRLLIGRIRPLVIADDERATEVPVDDDAKP